MSWMSDGHQQHTHIADDLQEEIIVTGRLPQTSSPRDTQLTNGMCCILNDDEC